MIAPTSRRSSSSKPRIVTAGVPRRMPEASIGGRSSNGTVLRSRDLHVVQALLRRAARPLAPAQVDLDEMGVGATVRRSKPPFRIPRARRRWRGSGLGRHGRLRSPHLEAGGLRRDHVRRAALHPGEDRLVDRHSMLLLAEDEPRSRAGEGLVARRGDEVAMRHWVRDGAPRRRARRCAPCRRGAARRPRRRSPGSDRPRSCAVSGGAADDQLRPVLLRQAAHLVEVDQSGLAIDPVADDVVELSEKFTLRPCVR